MLSGALAVLSLLLFYMVRGVASPVLKNYINNATTSSDRATVLSLRSLVIRIMFVIVGPLCGWLIDNYSYSIMLYTIGSLILVANCIFILPGILRQK
jgi:predicted MFS family arabinose efflux permease